MYRGAQPRQLDAKSYDAHHSQGVIQEQQMYRGGQPRQADGRSYIAQQSQGAMPSQGQQMYREAQPRQADGRSYLAHQSDIQTQEQQMYDGARPRQADGRSYAAYQSQEVMPSQEQLMYGEAQPRDGRSYISQEQQLSAMQGSPTNREQTLESRSTTAATRPRSPRDREQPMESPRQNKVQSPRENTAPSPREIPSDVYPAKGSWWFCYSANEAETYKPLATSSRPKTFGPKLDQSDLGPASLGMCKPCILAKRALMTPLSAACMHCKEQTSEVAEEICRG